MRDGNKRITTYGKRKQGMSPARSKFDDAALQEGLQTPASGQWLAFPQLKLPVPNVPQAVSKQPKLAYGSRYNLFASRKSNEDSIDDLANEILDDTLPPRLQSSGERLSFGQRGSPSNAIPPEKSRKMSISAQSLYARQSRSLLVPKQTKSPEASSPRASPRKQQGKITRKHHQRGASQLPLPSIVTITSESLEILPNPLTADTDSKQASAVPSNNWSPSPDPAELSRKLTLLMPRDTEEVKSQAGSLKASGSPSKVANPKLTPLQRGKGALKKVKRALSGRKSNSSEEAGSSWRSRLPHSTSRSIIAELTGSDRPRQEIEVKKSSELLSRQKAEEENLNKSKIRLLTGDTSRGPLPIYESMKKKRLSSMSTEDLISPAKATGESPRVHRHTKSADASDFLSRGNLALDSIAPRAPETASNSSKSDSSIMEQDYRFASNITKEHRFSSSISGLRQHPDVMFFSSPPRDFSTPTDGMEESFNAGVKKHLSTVPSAGSSLADLYDDNQAHDNLAPDGLLPDLEISDVPLHDGTDDDDSADELGLDSAPLPEPGLTLKRKSGSSDLRCVSPPGPRKLRKVAPNPESSPRNTLTSDIAQLTTSDNSVLGVKDGNTKLRRNTASASKRNGLHIFDVGKGKEREKIDDRVEESEALGKRGGKVWSSTAGPPKPASSRHGNNMSNADWRARTSVPDNYGDEDSMSVDELQVSQYCV